MTLEDRIAAIERHLFGRPYTDEVETPAEPEAAADVAAEDAPAEDPPADPEPVRDGGPASV